MKVDHTATAPVRPDAPHVLLVYPGHHTSTRDVADNLYAGFQSAGCVVQPFRFHDWIAEVAWLLEQEWEKVGKEDASGRALEVAANAVFPVALAFRPDLIVVVNGMAFPFPAAVLLGQYAPTAIVLTESPYMFEREDQLQTGYRTAFTNERTAVARLLESRRRDRHSHPDAVYYLPHSFDPARHYPRPFEVEYASDVCFIGSPFPERQELFRGVDWTGIHLVTRGLWTDPDDTETSLDPETGFVTNDEAHRWYAGAKIVVNHHRVIRYFGSDMTIGDGEAESLNPRVYELAAARCFQVCDDSRPELTDVFGGSIPTYRAGDSADLERVLRYYLARPEERARCAADAYERVQAHTAETRARLILDACLRGHATTTSAVTIAAD
jgi:spore maturation protein CgeB